MISCFVLSVLGTLNCFLSWGILSFPSSAFRSPMLGKKGCMVENKTREEIRATLELSLKNLDASEPANDHSEDLENDFCENKHNYDDFNFCGMFHIQFVLKHLV